jgi:hypothetical protein
LTNCKIYYIYRAAKGMFLSFLLLTCLIAGTEGQPGRQTNDASGDCGGTTVDTFQPELAGPAKAFLADLQTAVRAEDKQKIASMAAYPLVTFRGKERRSVRNRSEFLHRYGQIFTPDVTRVVLGQSPDCLFANWQGVMIGRGQVWFADQPDKSLKIISVNPGAPEPRSNTEKR